MTLFARFSRAVAGAVASLSVAAFAAGPSAPPFTPPSAKAAPLVTFLSPDSAPALRLDLAPVDLTVVDAMKRRNQAALEKRLQIGLGRETAGAAGASSAGLSWQAVANGHVARWEIRSPDAKALRVGLAVGTVPTGLQLRFGGSTDATIYGPVVASEMLAAGNVYWSPVMEGDTATVELFVPTGQSTDQVAMWVAGVSHLLASPADPKADALLKASAGTCEVNFICRAGSDAELARTGSAVARMVFTDSGSSYLCTGTVLSNTAATSIPYFATAAHCISTQASATSLATYWLYQTTSCTGTTAGPSAVQRFGGAKLLFTDTTGTDFTLLQLNDMPPGGVTYAGWDATTMSAGLPVDALHHPQGDVKKISLGTSGGFEPILDFGLEHISFTQTFLRINWNSISTGVTEGGSSGSGIFTGSASFGYKYRGGLLGGPSGCDQPQSDAYDYYSRFDLAYPSVAQYLSPSSCSYSISGSSANIAAAGGSGTFTITVSGGCAWTAVSGASWITTTSSGSGNGTVSYTVAPNSGGARAAVITVGGQNFTINQAAGLSSSTDNYTALWYTSAEPGWGLDLSHQGNTIFAALFTYASDGQPMWLYASGLVQQADGSFTGGLARNPSGPPFYAQPWSSPTPTTVGTMTLRFTSLSSGTLTYTFNGTTVSKNISRFDFGSTVPVCTSTTASRATATNYQDIWWNANESGWGLELAHQGNTIFASLYTYDDSGRDLWLYADNLARQPDGTFSGALYRATGPVFNASPWGSYAPVQVGTMTLAFSAGDTGTLTYTVGTRMVAKAITRYAFSATPTVCQ